MCSNTMPGWRAFALLAFALPASVFAQALADPLRPAAFAVASGESVSGVPVLSMIVIRNDRSWVVLDGSVRRLGEHFGGYRLASIKTTQVSLVSDDGQRLAVDRKSTRLNSSH